MELIFVNYSRETFTPTNSGAISTVVWNLCREARRDSIEPTVITLRDAIPPYDWEKTHFVDYPPFPENPVVHKLHRARRKLTGWQHIRQQTYMRRVAEIIRKNGLERACLVINNDPEIGTALRKCFPQARILHLFHNHLECDAPFRAQIGASADVIAACSRYTGAWIEDYYGLTANRVATLYNGVDIERFHPLPEPISGLPVITFVGRTGIEKAPDLVLKAALILARRTKNFRVRLIGSNQWGHLTPDAYQRELMQRTEALEAAGICVERPGHMDRLALPGVLRTGHIHVVPSRWDEPFGLTTVEGMASGLAIVASNTGGTPEVVGDAGFLFERDSAEDLAAKLEPLISDETLRHEYSRRARARAETFSWAVMWNRLRELTGV